LAQTEADKTKKALDEANAALEPKKKVYDEAVEKAKPT